jgi:hypothetical protein
MGGLGQHQAAGQRVPAVDEVSGASTTTTPPCARPVAPNRGLRWLLWRWRVPSIPDKVGRVYLGGSPDQ